MAETITQREFDERREAGELALTLVGMSNVGKSFWSTSLTHTEGFSVIGCDDLIEAELGTVLQEAGLNGGITDVAKWMGQPHDLRFAANQQTYLDLETMTIRRTIDRLKQPPLGGNIVVDTTGSVVHTSGELCEDLASHSTVVYLEATAEMQQAMFELYIAEPKPVVWGDVYCGQTDKSPQDALARCYPELLSRRSGLYRQMAHVIIPRQMSLDLDSGADFLARVRGMLPA